MKCRCSGPISSSSWNWVGPGWSPELFWVNGTQMLGIEAVGARGALSGFAQRRAQGRSAGDHITQPGLKHRCASPSGLGLPPPPNLCSPRRICLQVREVSSPLLPFTSRGAGWGSPRGLRCVHVLSDPAMHHASELSLNSRDSLSFWSLGRRGDYQKSRVWWEGLEAEWPRGQKSDCPGDRTR